MARSSTNSQKERACMRAPKAEAGKPETLAASPRPTERTRCAKTLVVMFCKIPPN